MRYGNKAYRLLALTLVLVVALGIAAPAFASTTMYATTNLNVRKGPGTKYAIVGVLYKGQAVTKVGSSGNWTKISWNGGTAYAYTKYLSKNPVSTTVQKQLLYTTTVFSGPGTSYSTLGYLLKGQIVTVLGTYGNWAQIAYGASPAYVYAGYLTDVGGSGYAVTPASGTVSITARTIFYASPSSSSAQYGTLYKNEIATRTGTYGSNWTQIKFNGLTGFVRTSDTKVLTSVNADKFITVNRVMYAKYSKVYCYSIPYTSSSSYAKGYLSKYEDVILLSSDGTWGKIIIDDTIYYVLVSELDSYGAVPPGYSSFYPSTGSGKKSSSIYPTYRDLEPGDVIGMREASFLFSLPSMTSGSRIKDASEKYIIVDSNNIVEYQSLNTTYDCFKVKVYTKTHELIGEGYIPTAATSYPTGWKSSSGGLTNKLESGDRLRISQATYLFKYQTMKNNERWTIGGNYVILDGSSEVYYLSTASGYGAYKVKAVIGGTEYEGYIPSGYASKYY